MSVQKMVASAGPIDKITSGALSVFTDISVRSYVTACVSYDSRRSVVSDIFRRPLQETKSDRITLNSYVCQAVSMYTEQDSYVLMKSASFNLYLMRVSFSNSNYVYKMSGTAYDTLFTGDYFFAKWFDDSPEFFFGGVSESNVVTTKGGTRVTTAQI